MRIAETVTFGGSGLDRAAQLRGDAAAIAARRSDPAARVLPFWRGRPLAGAGGLAWVSADHPILASGGAEAVEVFLGLDAAGPRFACDLSAWTPEVAGTGGADPFQPAEQPHPAAPGLAFAELRPLMGGLSARDAECAAMARALFSWHQSHGFCAACGAHSRVVSAGWQRQCPSCNAAHFPRTDPVVIMLITRGNRVLLGRSPGWPPGMYSLLAGFVEPGETVEAAVRREVAEEAGVPVGRVDYLASQPWPFPASLMLGCRGEALDDAIRLDPAELEAARWITREEMARVFAGEHPEIRPPRQGAIAGFLLFNWLADRLD